MQLHYFVGNKVRNTKYKEMEHYTSELFKSTLIVYLIKKIW